MSLGAITVKLEELIKVGLGCSAEFSYDDWSIRAASFLRQAFNPDVAKQFTALAPDRGWLQRRAEQIGMLEGLAAFQAETFDFLGSASDTHRAVIAAPNSKRVFLVHGHDHGAKETVARHLERLGLDVVILHEQANEGRTVIEKIEAHSDVSFAVVLLTPDDISGLRKAGFEAQPRARQNVVLELGYFLGKLKRSRVCALYVPGVEIPSDYQGVLYIELDDKGAWRMQLAQELSNARLPINVAGLLNS